MNVTLQNLGTLVRKERGNRSLREVAAEVGTSAPTLSRIEAGKTPDLETFGKLCRWLRLDPSSFLGVAPLEHDSEQPSFAVAHLKAQREVDQATAQSLARLIMNAQMMLADPPEGDDGKRF